MLPAAEHLFWTYRLAKFEVTAERRGVGRFAFGRFERDLANKLSALAKTGISPDRLFRDIEPGRVWVRPKAVDRPARPADHGLFVSVPQPTHDHQITGMSVRVLLEPTPEFATSEILWLRQFGAALEAVLGPQCLGNRLDVRGEPPSIAVGGRRAYRYWAPAYRKFRQQALALAKRSLKKPSRRCALVVLDLAAYYDNINPSFLVLSDFLDEVEAAALSRSIPFDRAEYLAATEGLLSAFRRFRAAVKKEVGVGPRRGIPIGSLTARIIANLALVELDRHVASRPGVCHYARYVDDILIVQEPQGEPEELSNDMIGRFLPLDEIRTDREKLVLDEVLLKRPGSSFTVQPAKLRVFSLQGEQGLEYLGTVEAEMERVSSERRRFLKPWVSEIDQTVAASPNEEPIRALRQADALRLRKLAVGTTCDKVTTAAAMLTREEASKFSRTYLGKAGRLATDWSQWVDLLDVSLRILGAALVSGDRDTANEVIEAILARVASLANGQSRSFKVCWGAAKVSFRRAQRMLRNWVDAQLVEVICSATPFDGVGFTVTGVKAIDNGLTLDGHHLGRSELLEKARLLACTDLRLVNRETDHWSGCPTIGRPPETMRVLETQLASETEFTRRRPGIVAFLDVCREQRDQTYAQMGCVDLLLAQRLPTYTDVLFRWIRGGRAVSELVEVVNAVRGTRYRSLPMEERDNGVWVEPPSGSAMGAVGAGDTRVVLGNLCTDEAWWKASLTSPVLTVERQRRLARILNQAMDAARRARGRGIPTLLVLPELSLPQRWAREVFRHLSSNEPALSLVAGVEYDVIGRDVYNEVVAFLPRGFFSAAGWVWTKRRPAHREGPDLKNQGFDFATRGENRRFLVMSSEHGDFLPLICSELLEVDTRAQLLGRVNLVLVPAWNPDIPSFEYLVHSSALELHSFIAVANNGVFSDCRVRGPYAETWQREVCRLIARNEDETVVADLPIGRLLEYRVDPGEYDRRRAEWIENAKRNGQNGSDCPWPAWKPVPPGMRS